MPLAFSIVVKADNRLLVDPDAPITPDEVMKMVLDEAVHRTAPHGIVLDRNDVAVKTWSDRLADETIVRATFRIEGYDVNDIFYRVLTAFDGHYLVLLPDDGQEARERGWKEALYAQFPLHEHTCDTQPVRWATTPDGRKWVRICASDEADAYMAAYYPFELTTPESA